MISVMLCSRFSLSSFSVQVPTLCLIWSYNDDRLWELKRSSGMCESTLQIWMHVYNDEEALSHGMVSAYRLAHARQGLAAPPVPFQFHICCGILNLWSCDSPSFLLGNCPHSSTLTKSCHSSSASSLISILFCHPPFWLYFDPHYWILFVRWIMLPS